MIIIGITGTNGSGKGTVVSYLVEHYGFAHYSARAFLSEEIARRGMPDNRDSTYIVGNDLRLTFGAGYVAEQLYKRALENNQPAVIESLRSTGEVEALRSLPGNFSFWAIDADPHIRYERILQRKSSTDSVSFEKFLSDEEREMHDTRPNGMNVAECMKLADVHIHNSGSIDELYTAIDTAITPLLL